MKIPALLLTTLLCISPAAAQARHPDTFQQSKLTAKEIQEIITAVESLAYDTPDSWTKELLVKRVDLGAVPGWLRAEAKCYAAAPGTARCSCFANRRIDGCRCS